MTATYGMINVTIEKIVSGGHESWLVYADTERFGDHQIMAQFGREDWAREWCRDNGVDIPQTARERAREEIAKSGKVQIGCAMYRRLYEEDDRIYGYSPSWYGFRDITKLIDDCEMTGPDTGRTSDRKASGRYSRYTVKFGNACTW